jgi:hypothetical protein
LRQVVVVVVHNDNLQYDHKKWLLMAVGVGVGVVSEKYERKVGQVSAFLPCYNALISMVD